MPDQLTFRTLGGARDREKLTPLTRIEGPDGFVAIVYQSILNEDNDGAPTCYGPDGISPPAIEPLRYATNHAGWVFSSTNHKFEWHAVVHKSKSDAQAEEAAHKPPRWKIDPNPALEDRNGTFPVVKQKGADKGYYVSTTSTLANASLDEWEQARYLNAAEIPYAALTPPLVTQQVRLGDVGLAINSADGKKKGFFFADSGNEDKVGECSRNLFRTFFPTANQEHHDIIFLVFPGSGAGLRGPSGIDGAVKKQLIKLAQAPNADDLITFFARPVIWDFLSAEEKLRLKDSEFRGKYQNILRALRDKGYRPQVGDFVETGDAA